MASLNTSTNGPSIKSSYTGVINSPPPSGAAANSPTYGQWALFSVSAPLVNAFQQDSGGKESILKVQSTGEGELIDLIDDFSEGRVQFAFLKVKDSNTALPKYVLIGWCGEGVPERTKGYFTSHLAAVSKILHGYHVQVTARSDRDLTPESIVQKVADASGSKYSAGSSAPAASSGPPPPLASKPAFNPTRSSAASGFNPLASSRSKPGQHNSKVDEDGWGADAPEVTRSQLERVAPAYQPTKVNMAELTKQKEPSRFNGGSRADDNTGPNVVKGAYQPVGKVDIAAIRAQAQKAGDDRPTIVKGAYEPVGKVDIAAIRARAQKPSDDGARQLSPSATGASATSNTSDEPRPKSLADRSSAFVQSDRLTSLPKPKVANRFGSSTSNFSGTKAPTPGAFGLQSAPPTVATPPVGAAKTYADEGGKTPAQIWAEKKARQRGLSGAGDAPSVTSPIASQTSGGGEWKSGYAGKSWAPVATTATGKSGTGSIGQQRTGEEEREEEAPSSPVGGIGALRDRFKGGAPMGAPSMARETTGEQTPPPPPINSSTRPTGGVPMPGFPARPQSADEEDEQDGPNIPPPPAVPRSPTPPTPDERDTSPVRIAMPIARSTEPELHAPEERNDPPALPTQIGRHVPDEEDLTEEPAGHDPARAAGAAVAATSFGENAGTTNQGSAASGKRAVVQYDYEKAEDNELELVEGEYVTNIEMVDEDWWMGTNQKGESGLFPSNYVELVEGGAEEEEEEEEAPAPVSAPAQAPRPAAAPAAPTTSSGPTAKALYDYEAAEDNELSFPEEATVTGLEFPDEDWWFGHYGGKSGLFPSNYVQLDE
ncbi:Drebrin B [Hyphodiscus hymeniophilus]|uniref:Drebrin B n=1 Tax=Hyphodiscus hymeniophilus TaxID=353542 RepID=A0A9P6VHH6_9HELO|nr:Drebrin B [Hyphodiscus hymeniophilus]